MRLLRPGSCSLGAGRPWQTGGRVAQSRHDVSTPCDRFCLILFGAIIIKPRQLTRFLKAGLSKRAVDSTMSV